MADILLVIIIKHTEESSIVFSRIFPILFLRLGLKFISDREYFLVEMCILLSLVIFGSCGRGAKVGKIKY